MRVFSICSEATLVDILERKGFGTVRGENQLEKRSPVNGIITQLHYCITITVQHRSK